MVTIWADSGRSQPLEAKTALCKPFSAIHLSRQYDAKGLTLNALAAFTESEALRAILRRPAMGYSIVLADAMVA